MRARARSVLLDDRGNFLLLERRDFFREWSGFDKININVVCVPILGPILCLLEKVDWIVFLFVLFSFFFLLFFSSLFEVV